MEIQIEGYCPQWRKPCSKVCPTCRWWVQVKGENRNTGEDASHYECAIVASLLMGGEMAYQARAGAAETEAMRNELAKRMDQHTRHTMQMIGAAAQIGRSQAASQGSQQLVGYEAITVA